LMWMILNSNHPHIINASLFGRIIIDRSGQIILSASVVLERKEDKFACRMVHLIEFFR
jgi:hypothetical protein